MRTRVTGGQEAFLISNPATGQEHIAPGALPNAESVNAVNLLDRDVELLGVLATFGELDQYGGLKIVMASPRRKEIEARYGSNTPAVMSGVERSRTQARREAKWSFARAGGMFAMIDTLPTLDAAGQEIDNHREVQNIRSRFARLFVRLQLKYEGAHKRQDREDYQTQLLRNVRSMQDQVTLENREQGLRPHRRKQPKAKAVPTMEARDKPTDQPLGTRERLIPLQEDARAGFFPTTHREKNKVLDDLDYLDNPKYPLGTTNRQLEIFNHSARLRKSGSVLPDGPERAAYSLTHELLDYFYDARESLILLRALDEEMIFRKSDLLNPYLSVGLTEVHESHKDALMRVLRFIDIGKYAHKDGSRTFADPLRTREDRWAKAGAGKHKKVHDIYTQPETAEQRTKLDTAVFGMTVKELRDSIAPSILDQTKRVLFFASRIQEVANGLDQDTFRDTRDLALVALGNIEIEFLPHAA